MNNWTLEPFGKLADFKNGLNFRAGETGHELKVLGVGDFKERTKLEQVTDISSIHTEKKIDKSYLLQDGDLVFVRSNGNPALVGRCMQIFTNNEDISFSGFTIRARLKTDKTTPEFISLLMQGGLLKNILKRDGRGTNISNLNQDILSKLQIPIPSKAEQMELLSVFGCWDNAIEKTEALIAAKEKQFEWLTSNLINRAGHKRTSASGLMTEVSKRNKNSTIERVLSVTNHSGFVLPEEQFERRVASANVSNYKVVEQGQYAYNPSRINVGSIARLDDWENGILSPMYVVFKLDTKKVYSDYFLHWLNSSEARQRIKNSAQGSVRETVSFKDLGAINIPLPAMDVQKDVTYKLNLAQKEIILLKKTLEQYRSQKRGLMQKLLTGEWQVSSSQHLSEEAYQEASA
ncbi:TPA: restriction endonuclease subunit S [Vibrio parahaemolyticus]